MVEWLARMVRMVNGEKSRSNYGLMKLVLKKTPLVKANTRLHYTWAFRSDCHIFLLPGLLCVTSKKNSNIFKMRKPQPLLSSQHPVVSTLFLCRPASIPNIHPFDRSISRHRRRRIDRQRWHWKGEYARNPTSPFSLQSAWYFGNYRAFEWIHISESTTLWNWRPTRSGHISTMMMIYINRNEIPIGEITTNRMMHFSSRGNGYTDRYGRFEWLDILMEWGVMGSAFAQDLCRPLWGGCWMTSSGFEGRWRLLHGNSFLIVGNLLYTSHWWCWYRRFAKGTWDR